LIADGVARARACGASDAGAIARFVHLLVVFGPALEALPWARAILSDASVADADTRIEVLALRAREILATRGRGA
jgi:hypothetical protein